MALLGQFGPQDEEILKRMQVQSQAMQRMQPAQQPAPQQNMLQRMGGGIKDYLSDPSNRARLAVAFNSMRMNPDPNIAAMAQSRIDHEQVKRGANRTVELLAKMGRPDLAKAVEQQPELAMDALKQVYGMGGASAKSYAPQLDPVTGQYYIPQYDPQTNEAKRINIEGAIGETPEAKAKRELDNELLLADYSKARQVGQDAMSRANMIDDMISRLSQAYDALERGGKSGPFRQFLPSFDEATSTLRQAANQLGIDIINSATFGALSASELKLALETGLPMSLDEEELKKYIRRKVAAQVKLRDELVKQARTLASGEMRYSDYIKQYEPKGGTEIFLGGGGIQRPPSITEEEWNAMTQEQRNLFK